MAWILNLSESNKHIFQLPPYISEKSNTNFHFFLKMFWRAYFVHSIAKIEEGRNFPIQCVFNSWFEFLCSYIPFDSPGENFPSLSHTPLNLLLWIMCEHGDINEPQHKTTFLPTARNELKFFADAMSFLCFPLQCGIFQINFIFVLS